MQTKKATFYLTSMAIGILLSVFTCLTVQAQIPSFPGAEGFGATTTGGRGGQVIYVTNLNCSGPGSLNDALTVPGPKCILFTVSGIIDCAAEIIEGDCYLAGQTSPDGIIVRGIIADDYYTPSAHPDNIIIRHMRSRSTGFHPCPNFATDPMIISGVRNMIVDHCSFSGSEDEAVDISRSLNLTLQNCILAETVDSHYYLGGMLINYSSPGQIMDSISIHHNNWNRIGGRMPELSCEDPTGCTGATFHLEYSCNLLWDQQIAVYHNIDTDLSNGSEPGFVEPYYIDANMINNYGISRVGYCDPMFLAPLLETSQNDMYINGNHHQTYPSWTDYQLFGCCNDFCITGPNTDTGAANLLSSRHPYPLITYHNAVDLEDYMVNNVGAYPRFPHEIRLMAAIQNNVMDTTSLFTYAIDDLLLLPTFTNTPPTDTDFDGMPDYWENNHGLNPNVADPNATNLSMTITGINGYTNLECYLNCLADALVNGCSPSCQIPIGIEKELNPIFKIYPNPVTDFALVELIKETDEIIYAFDALGKTVLTQKSTGIKTQINLQNLPAGMYYIKVGNYTEPIVKQ